ncbi:MAG: acyl-CoA thioesterase [Muribaculaceae bacterium]|nr:acyl-CoA thioesterase [Muribaculaceae bacterium]
MPILKDNKIYCYALEMMVRDYELDSQGIVNNANYLHYMEHTRHSFCMEAGMSFGELHRMGIDPVVRKIEIEYKSSLRIGDNFISCLKVERKGPRFVFKQDIIFPNGEYAAQATITVVSLKNGRLSRGDELAAIFAPYFK